MRLDELKFTAEDFGEGKLKTSEFISPMQATEIANRILAEKLERAPKVFLVNAGRDGYRVVKNREIPDITHKARLVCIEEIN